MLKQGKVVSICLMIQFLKVDTCGLGVQRIKCYNLMSMMIVLRPMSHHCLFASEPHTSLFNTQSPKGGECIGGGGPTGDTYGDVFATYVTVVQF